MLILFQIFIWRSYGSNTPNQFPIRIILHILVSKTIKRYINTPYWKLLLSLSISKVLWKITKHDEKIKPYIHIRTLNFELQPFSIDYIFLKKSSMSPFTFIFNPYLHYQTRPTDFQLPLILVVIVLTNYVCVHHLSIYIYTIRLSYIIGSIEVVRSIRRDY